MEGVAYEYMLYKDIIDGLVQGQSYDYVLCVGGGSTSRVFSQIKADALGIPVATGTTTKGALLVDAALNTLSNAALNAALNTALLACASIAGHGVGLFDDIAELSLGEEDYSERALPDAANHREYKLRKEIFAGLYDALHDTYGRLLAL
jgi:xylulokinase